MSKKEPWEVDIQKTKEELKEYLTPEQYTVTQEDGTEKPFTNEYCNNNAEGIYVDLVSGEPLFSSLDKYDSGTGWPSFSQPIDSKYISYKEDRKLFRKRTEVRSRYANSHLGHVFDDGPKETGKRYCMNSAALRFIPKERLKEEGYEKFLALFTQESETALFGGGCFWGVEEIFKKIPGVLSTTVGYAGGSLENPTYEQVVSTETGHAEVVEVTFNPQDLSYLELIDYFFRLHNPTTLNRQGNDQGTQYRSVIFYKNDKQKNTAMKKKQEVDQSGQWADPVVTEIVPNVPFYSAEEHHQDYLEKNPGGYTCHVLRES